MPLLTNIYEDDGELYPVAIGVEHESEIYDPSTKSWSGYESIPDRSWATYDCFIYYRDLIYHIDNGVVSSIDPSVEWQVTVLGTTPDGVSRRPLKCAGTVINGFPGIFTAEGDWLNLKTMNWEQYAPIPDNCEANRPNNLWSFQGKPTVFGAPVCDGLGDCYYSQVIQYQAEIDEWTLLGDMHVPRRSQEVVEVPKSFCDFGFPTTTQTPSTTTDDGSATGPTDTTTTDDGSATGPTDETTTTTTEDDVNPTDSTTTEDGSGSNTTTDAAANIKTSSTLAILLLTSIKLFS